MTARPLTAAGAGCLICHGCRLAVRSVPVPLGAHARCPRCGAALHRRKPHSLARTWALMLTAYVLYIPANLLPVMTVVMSGRGEPDTILSGVKALIEGGMWPLALVVFFASITVPVLKLLVLTWLLISVKRAPGCERRRASPSVGRSLSLPARSLPAAAPDALRSTRPDPTRGSERGSTNGSTPGRDALQVSSVGNPPGPSGCRGLLDSLAFASLPVSQRQRKSRWRPRERTVLYRITEGIGRWSMIDVFVISILVALVKLGALATIEAGAGALAFSGVVVFTMFAAMSFDPRLIWDALETTNDNQR